MMKCRVKNETYMEEQKLKIAAMNLTPIDYLSGGVRCSGDPLRQQQ